MSATIVIDGREAIPARAIPFVTGWMVSPDVVAKIFSKTDHWATRLEGISAYYLSVNGKYSPVLPKEWDGILADLQILSDKLASTETIEQENYPAWRQQSILLLPASCFVWRNEFEEAFRRSYSPTRFTLLDERPGDRELNFSPRIPEDLVLPVMQGFNHIQVTQEPDATPKAGHDIATCQPEHFVSLVEVLGEWFGTPLESLPDEQRRRVRKNFFPMPWDDLSPEQRRSVAMQWDYQNDPAMEGDRQYWWDLFIRKEKLKKQIEKWSAIATPTAMDLAQKETRLAELQRELTDLEKVGLQVESINPDQPHISDIAECRTKPVGHLNHDPEMQARANQIAAEKMSQTGRSITREKVAKILAKELDMDEATVVRRIRKQWK